MKVGLYVFKTVTRKDLVACVVGFSGKYRRMECYSDFVEQKFHRDGSWMRKCDHAKLELDVCELSASKEVLEKG